MSEVSEVLPPAIPLKKDYLLVALVEAANSGLSVGVTLNVGGTLVSGILSSGREYMESVADLFEGVNEQGELMASIYRKFAIKIYPDVRGDEDIEFIHLKDAVIFHGTTDFNISLWRGKLNAVDGFSFGTLKK